VRRAPCSHFAGRATGVLCHLGAKSVANTARATRGKEVIRATTAMRNLSAGVLPGLRLFCQKLCQGKCWRKIVEGVRSQRRLPLLPRVAGARWSKRSLCCLLGCVAFCHVLVDAEALCVWVHAHARCVLIMSCAHHWPPAPRMAGSSGQLVFPVSSDEEGGGRIECCASDDEQQLIPAAAAASRRPRARGQGAPDGRVTAAATLVTRTCRCKAADCLTQFRHNVCEIEAARIALHRADPAEQEMQIAWMFCGGAEGVQERLQRVVNLVAADAESAPAIMYESDVDKASQGIMYASDSSGGTSSEPDSPQRPPRGTKRKYRHRAGAPARSGMFLGLPVCHAALARLLAIGTGVIEKVRHGVKTCHRGKGRLHPKHPLLNVSLLRAHSGIVWPTVLSFFWLVYHSSAEGLPTQHVLMRDIRGKNGVRVALQDALAEGKSGKKPLVNINLVRF